MDEEGSDNSDDKDSGHLRNVTREVSEMAGASEDTVVSNSLLSKSTIEKMWEGNASVDCRVMGTSSWMAEENLGMEQRVGNICAGIRDLTKCELEVDGRDAPK
ncbi:hypothetical protein V6N12_064919 [Hibiscus sabdariffa]|uniref:Uncharacterized protein n=1 Tax=Hibiscus sabdariffa TaxID=183260 RepID=A0ABR2G772_9ROSI